MEWKDDEMERGWKRGGKSFISMQCSGWISMDRWIHIHTHIYTHTFTHRKCTPPNPNDCLMHFQLRMKSICKVIRFSHKGLCGRVRRGVTF